MRWLHIESDASNASLSGSSMSLDDTESHEQSPDEVFQTAVLFESALAVVALFLGWLLGPSAREMVPEISAENLMPIYQGLGIGMVAAIPILVVIELIRRIPWDPIRELERLTEDGMIRSLLKLRPAELIVISICAGVGEELLFRGWLMYWIADGVRLAVPQAHPYAILATALVASSVVFGLFHPITRLYIVLAALMGLYFGALVIWTENLLVPIVAHATYDAVQLLLAKREVSRQPT